MKAEKEIRDWYNDFSKKQIEISINLRHYSIVNHLIDAGLKKNHSVLEIGCGIGTLTKLIHKYLKTGKIFATDISDESINIAKSIFSKTSSNVEFIVTNMENFSHSNKFDFIVLPDVLEHIPIEQHRNLFQVISNHMHDNSKILIHIPHPKALDFIRKFQSEKLQIIDQSISAEQLLKDTYHNGLTLVNYTSYSLYNKEADYALIILQKNRDLSTLTPFSKPKIIYKKALSRLHFWLKMYL
ncbi:MAG: class I SAM-dependent methyltransferase [Bacteroidia bacterium]